jgi:phospholipid/cholesterol/gamma-HCH transport system substrate-binding protein
MVKEQKIRLGVFLFVTLLFLIIILFVLIVPKLREQGEMYYTNFTDTSVSGLYVGTAVKFQGVEIGKVSQISVNPADLNSILIQMKIKRGFPVKKDMGATLTYTGLTGQRFIQLSGGSIESENLAPGGEILALTGLSEKAEDIVSNIDATLKSINTLLNPESQKRIRQFLENMEKSSDVLSSVLETRKSNLENAIANIENASQDFGQVTNSLYSVLQNLTTMSERVEKDTEETFANISRRFSEEEMGQAIRNLEEFISTVTDSIQTLQNIIIQQQSELSQTFDDLRAVIENLDSLSRDLVEDPTLLIRTRKGKGK